MKTRAFISSSQEVPDAFSAIAATTEKPAFEQENSFFGLTTSGLESAKQENASRWAVGEPATEKPEVLCPLRVAKWLLTV